MNRIDNQPMVWVVKDGNSRFGRIVAEIIFSFFLILILGTILGLWVKLYWLGWVLKGLISQ